MRIGQAIDEIFQDIDKQYEGLCEENFKYTLQYDTQKNEVTLKGPFGAPMRNILENRFSEMDWKLIEKPVSFMEAVESGNRFRVEHPFISPDHMENYIGVKAFLHKLLISFHETHIHKILTEGKFYIQEED